MQMPHNQPYPMPPPPPDQFAQGQQEQFEGGEYGFGNESQIEEIAEAIIDEKWGELVKNINKIIEWKNATEARINSLDQAFKDLKHEFDKLQTAVVGKVGEYDKNILEVGAEIKAMEKVFQKVLPAFTENVNELSRIVYKVKSDSGQKK